MSSCKSNRDSSVEHLRDGIKSMLRLHLLQKRERSSMPLSKLFWLCSMSQITSDIKWEILTYVAWPLLLSVMSLRWHRKRDANILLVTYLSM